MDDFPTPNKTDGIDFAWDQLTLGVNSQASYHEIVADFWQVIVPILDRLKSVQIRGPEEEAWFHLRRTPHLNRDPASARYAKERIEILRLKRGHIAEESQEQIREYTSRYPDVVCAGWWPINFTGRHDNAFLSFLQKLSVLLIMNGRYHKKDLGEIRDDYEKCPICREAYQVMRSADKPWFEDLKPWYQHMDAAGIGENRTHEYAHWFGHILTGWDRK